MFDFSALDRFLASLPERFHIPAYDFMVLRDGVPIYRNFGGKLNIENDVPMRADAVWQLYSSSKMYTCTAALQLYEQGAFYLNQPLSDFYPEFAEMQVLEKDGTLRPATEPIRIRHLFAMTAGFTYDVNSPSLMQFRADTNGVCPTVDMPKYLAREPLSFEPGVGFEYSLCHDVLAALIEKWSGMTVGAYLQKHIFAPLGLRDTAYDLREDMKPRFVTKYHRKGAVLDKTDQSLGDFKLGSAYESGGAGLYSTTEDAVRFLDAVRDGRLISKATMELMRTNQLNEAQLRSFCNSPHRMGYGYGLGVRTMIDPAQGGALSPLGEFGWGGAAGTMQAVDPENRISLFFGQQLINPEYTLRLYLRDMLYAALK